MLKRRTLRHNLCTAGRPASLPGAAVSRVLGHAGPAVGLPQRQAWCGRGSCTAAVAKLGTWDPVLPTRLVEDLAHVGLRLSKPHGQELRPLDGDEVGLAFVGNGLGQQRLAATCQGRAHSVGTGAEQRRWSLLRQRAHPQGCTPAPETAALCASEALPGSAPAHRVGRRRAHPWMAPCRTSRTSPGAPPGTAGQGREVGSCGD